MPHRRTLVDALQLLALTFWAAALLSAAVAAVNVFPTLRAMPLTLGAYPHMPSEEHWRFAAGEIMEGVFFLTDLMQFVAIPLVAITLVAQFIIVRAARPRWRFARTIILLLAAGLFTLHATTIAPPMNRLLRAQWSAAAAGDVAEAERLRVDFQRLHVRADSILRFNALLVLTGIALTPLTLAPRDRGETGPDR